LKRGRGEILVSAFTDTNIEEVINYAIGFADTILGFEERPFPDLSVYDLTVRLRTPATSTPITGRSYELLLCLELILTFLGRGPTVSACVTGQVDDTGGVLDVGGIGEKRRGAKQLGFDRIILPGSQLDFFSTEIIQIPVSTIFEAYTAVTYGKTEHP
jgi:ATP-dependent Lon protease